MHTPFTARVLSWLAIAPLALAAHLAFAVGDIPFSADTLYPETASWSAKQHVFFVSSVRHGVVGKVTPQGQYSAFINDDKLVSSVGLTIDDKRNTLWVTSSDPGASDRTNSATQGKLAGVGAFDATTGQRRAWYNLGDLAEGAHFANDLALDAAGNVYVTDSFAPLIYRIDSDGKASIFARNDLFKQGDGFNLNGIAVHPDGYLLVGKYNSGQIFRVSLQHPDQVEEVTLPAALKGADGFLLRDSQHLVVVQNLGEDQTTELVSIDGWKTARVERQSKSLMSMPSSATQVGKDFYVLNSRIDTLFNKDAAKVSDFVLQKFEPARP